MEEIEKITNYTEPTDDRMLDPKEQVKDYEERIKSMTAKRDEKMANAREHFLARLDTIANQWKTANGLLEALHVLREVAEFKDYTEEVSSAANIAKAMSVNVSNFRTDIDDEDVEFWTQNCGTLIERNVLYDPNFVLQDGHLLDVEFIAEELCMLRFCATVGPDLDDCANFYKAANEEIASVQAKINELKAKK